MKNVNFLKIIQFALIIYAIFIYSCANKNHINKKLNDLVEKSWYYYDEKDDIYTECYINYDSIVFFDSFFYNFHSYKYKLRNDTIYLYNIDKKIDPRILVKPTTRDVGKLEVLSDSNSYTYLPLDEKIKFYSINLSDKNQYSIFFKKYLLRYSELKSNKK